MYRSNCKLVILVLVISVLSVSGGSPHGHYLGHELKPNYLRIDAKFTGESDPLSLHFSIVCGATRKRFEARFKLKIKGAKYTIQPPLDYYKNLLSFYNKECGRTPASSPDFQTFTYNEAADQVYMDQGPKGQVQTITLNKYES